MEIKTAIVKDTQSAIAKWVTRMRLDTATLNWVINLIEKKIEECKEDFDKDSKELAYRRIIGELQNTIRYGVENAKN